MYQATGMRVRCGVGFTVSSAVLLFLASLPFTASCVSTKQKPTLPKPPAVAKAATPGKADTAPGPAGQAKTEVKITDLWSDPEDRPLSSVVWSPKGDRIAFVAASGSAGDDDVHRADILVTTLPGNAQRARPTKLISLSRNEGVPAALFWMDNGRLGWAASPYMSHAFSFVQMGLQDSRPKPLVGRRFEGVQSRLSMESAFGGPDDVYYDPDSNSLTFCGGDTPSGFYVRILSVSTAKDRKLSVPNVCPTGWITLCGPPRGAKKPVLCVAAPIQGSGDRIWLSNSYALRQDKVLVTSRDRVVWFPRTSPDGGLLVYLSVFGETGLSEIMMYDLKSGRQRKLVTLAAQWEAGFYPVMGCPFSWSPDSKQIAYADGSKIKIVQVASLSPGSK